jgi:hypothetical protein
MIEGVTRVETFGDEGVHWVRATVDTRDPEVWRHLQEGEAFGAWGYEPLGGGVDELLLAKRTQKIGVVHREERAGDRLLDQLLKRDHHRGQAPPESLDSLPLGGPTLPPTMTYWRKL